MCVYIKEPLYVQTDVQNQSHNEMEAFSGPVGLQNLGNTCGFNSVVQALYASPTFRYIVLRLFERQEQHAPCGSALATLFVRMEDLAATPRAMVSPTQLLRALFQHQPLFTPGMQHDADEIWHGLIDTLDREERSFRTFRGPRMTVSGIGKQCDDAWVRAMTSSVVAACHGLRVQRMLCHDCQHRIDRFEPFATINLTPDPSAPSLQDLLRKGNKDTPLDDYRCEKCHSNRAGLGVRMWRPPPFLWVTLKRFAFVNGQLSKNNTRVQLTDTVDLADHVLLPPSTQAGLHYRLRSVVCHVGTLEGGHYYALVRDDRQGWFLLDDQHTAPLSSTEEFHRYAEHAYMLFFERAKTGCK